MDAQPAWLTNWQATHSDAPKPVVTTPRNKGRPPNASTRYVSDKPCKRGHVGERYVRSDMCVECQRLHNECVGEKRTKRLSSPQPGHHMDRSFDQDPVPWPDDGGAMRVPIYDRNSNPPRLVRKVGWVNCLGRYAVNRPHRLFSPDVVRVRVCVACKSGENRGMSFERD